MKNINIFGDSSDNILLANVSGDNPDASFSIYAGAGNDFLRGWNFGDLLRGGTGNDILVGGAGADSLYGGYGDDELLGDNGKDFLYGGKGSDELHGGNGNDTIFGEEGNDQLTGDAGNDVLRGGDGNDNLFGEFGNDVIFGGAGDDVLLFGFNDDTLTGGQGADLFVYDPMEYKTDIKVGPTFLTVIKDFQDDVDRLYINVNDASFSTFKHEDDTIVDVVRPAGTGFVELIARITLENFHGNIDNDIYLS